MFFELEKLKSRYRRGHWNNTYLTKVPKLIHRVCDLCIFMGSARYSLDNVINRVLFCEERTKHIILRNKKNWFLVIMISVYYNY